MTNNGFLRGITWDHVRGYGPLEASVRFYQAETGIQVSWAKRNLKDFGDVSLEKLAHEYDLIIMDHPHCGIASVTHCIMPLDEILTNEILQDASANSVGPSFASYQYDNHLWALPIDSACQVSASRKDLLGRLPIPQTWNQVFMLAEFLKTKRQYIAMALCPTDCNCCFLTLCAQAGDPFKEHKLPDVATGRYALTLLQKLAAQCHPASTGWNPINLYDHMAKESDVLYCPLAFGYSNYSRAGNVPNQLYYGAIPGKNNALLGGAGIAVSKFSENITKAAAYALWLCDEKFQSTIYVDAGGQPAHKKAWTSERANMITSNFFLETLPTIEAAYVRPRTFKWPLFQEELGEIIYGSITNNVKPEKAWREIEAAHKRYLGEDDPA